MERKEKLTRARYQDRYGPQISSLQIGKLLSEAPEMSEIYPET